MKRAALVVLLLAFGIAGAAAAYALAAAAITAAAGWVTVRRGSLETP